MKLDRPGAPHNEPLAPADWTMDLGSEGHLYFAEVRRGHQRMCRVSIAAQGLSEDELRSALADKARAWIADYLSRTHSGTTGFGEL